MSKKLTGQQRLFIDHYMATGNATRAAKEAHYAYPGKQGARLLANPLVRKELEKRMSKRSEKHDIDGTYLLQEMHKLYLRFIQEVKPQLNSKTGKPITDEDGNAVYTFNGQAALKALELMGKLSSVDAFGAQKVELTTEDMIIQRMLKDRGTSANQDEDEDKG